MKLAFDISIPFITLNKKFRNYGSKTFTVSKNKSFEVELYSGGSGVIHLLGFDFSFYPTGYDHSGLDIEITLLRYSIHLNIYDSRHWDYRKNCWEEYPDL
jgi:hypothetical protein